MEVPRHRTSIFLPLIFIALGVFFLLANLGVVQNDAWGLFATYWPILLILGGLDGLYQRESLIGSLLLLGLGILLLLTNLGELPWDTWFLIPRLWPIFLVALGLDLIFGRRNAIGSIIGAIVVIALVAGILFFSNMGLPTGGQQASQPIAQPVEGVNQANIKLTMIAGQLNVAGGSESNLLQGTVSLDKNEKLRKNFSTQGNVATLTLEPENSIFIPSGGMRQKAWDLQLSQEIPINLTTDVIFGETNILMSDMKLSRLKSTSVFGAMTITLPTEGVLDASVDGVFGTVTIIVPQDAAVRIKTDSAVSSMKVPRGFTQNGEFLLSPAASTSAEVIELDISQVFGTIVIQYPQP